MVMVAVADTVLVVEMLRVFSRVLRDSINHCVCLSVGLSVTVSEQIVCYQIFLTSFNILS